MPHQKLSVMKNYLFIIALLFLFSNCSTSDPEAAKAEALKSINSFYDAMTDFDYDLVRTYCTDNFYLIDDGKIYQNIDEFIAMLKTYEGADIKVSLEVKRANMDVKSGLIALEFVADISMGKDKMKVVAIESYVLKKDAGKWLIDFVHSTPLTESDNKKVAAKYHELKADDVNAILCEDFIGRNEKSRHTWTRDNHIKFLSNDVYKKDSIFHQIVEGDWVATRFVRTIDWKGERVQFEGMHFKRFENGKIAEVWEYGDTKQTVIK